MRYPDASDVDRGCPLLIQVFPFLLGEQGRIVYFGIFFAGCYAVGPYTTLLVFLSPLCQPFVELFVLVDLCLHGHLLAVFHYTMILN